VACKTEEKRGFWGIVSSALPEYLMAVGLFVALTPLPASANNDDNGKGIPAELAALQAQVASLQDQVNSLQASNTTLQRELATVQSNHALLLGPFVNVDPNPEIGVIGPNIIFSGANIHIVSGSGSTDDNGNRTGLGNLIIGYDEPPGSQPLTGLPLNPGDRGGSHNLVIGRFNRFTQAAQLVSSLRFSGRRVARGTHTTPYRCAARGALCRNVFSFSRVPPSEFFSILGNSLSRSSPSAKEP
jgi:hypothetical protein